MSAQRKRSPAGTFLRQQRLTRGLTQAELAQALGVRDKTVSRWESTGHPPQTHLRRPLAEKLGVELSELMRQWNMPISSVDTRKNVVAIRPDIAGDGSEGDKARFSAEQERFITASLTALENGGVTKSWLAAARAMAKVLGLPWDEGAG